LLYVTAPSKELVLNYWFDLQTFIPVNWNDKHSIKAFQNAQDKYAKTWSKLSYEDQGWVCEHISIHMKKAVDK